MSKITVSDVVERLGGTVQCSRKLGVARTTVIGWRKAEAVPASRLLAIHDLTGIEIGALRAIVAGAKESRPG